MNRSLKPIALFACALWFAAAPVWAQAVINVYGPGGPAPAMQEADKTFGAIYDITVNVAAGPIPQSRN